MWAEELIVLFTGRNEQGRIRGRAGLGLSCLNNHGSLWAYREVASCCLGPGPWDDEGRGPEHGLEPLLKSL
jgi:hypothetical protein